MRTRRLFRSALAMATLPGFIATPRQALPQQAPGTVLTNQMSIPVTVQTLNPDTAAKNTLTIPPDGSPIVQPGCLRFSTGKPAKTVYYTMERFHRYAFRSKGHQILLFDTSSDDAPLHPTNAANPSCKLFLKH